LGGELESAIAANDDLLVDSAVKGKRERQVNQDGAIIGIETGIGGGIDVGESGTWLAAITILIRAGTKGERRIGLAAAAPGPQHEKSRNANDDQEKKDQYRSRNTHQRSLLEIEGFSKRM
jgi:hypothetical protein